MPRLSQQMIRAAFLYLLAGLTIGALLLAHKGVPIHSALWALLPAHIEFLLIGWIVQITMGVAYWILPRYWQKPRRPRARLVQIAFPLLNAGIWLVFAGAVLRMGSWTLPAGRALEAGAIILFALHSWQRIVSRQGA
jgi:cbb3-type cytochrome oxidase subunit 1